MSQKSIFLNAVRVPVVGRRVKDPDKSVADRVSQNLYEKEEATFLFFDGFTRLS